MKKENEETWWKIVRELIPPQLLMAYKEICKNETEFEKYIFADLMNKKPELINKYKHLLDNITLKEIINEYPLTKIYLKD